MKNLSKLLIVAVLMGSMSFGISSCTRPGGPTGGAGGMQQQQAPGMQKQEQYRPGIEKQQGQPGAAKTQKTSATPTRAGGTTKTTPCPATGKGQTR